LTKNAHLSPFLSLKDSAFWTESYAAMPRGVLFLDTAWVEVIDLLM